MSATATDWQDQAACLDVEPDRFDYDPDIDPPAKADAAKQVCAGCRVRDACLSFALAQPADEDLAGIYGGLTPAERLKERRERDRAARSRGDHLQKQRRMLEADPTFAAVSFELASQVGALRAAEGLGVSPRTLQRAWRRHDLGGHPPTRPPKVGGARLLTERALRRLGWDGPARRLAHHQSLDPAFAARSFALAERIGVIPAAAQLGVSADGLRLVWRRHELGTPMSPQNWTRLFTTSRELVEQAFTMAREQSILATASTFQVSPPTLRRAFTSHGLGHPHEGLDGAELRRRWNEQPGPDHAVRAQRRAYRASQAAEQRATGERSQAPSVGRKHERARRSRATHEREEERTR